VQGLIDVWMCGLLGFELCVLVNLRFLSKSMAPRAGVLIVGVVAAVCVNYGFRSNPDDVDWT
jgi:hypothetical protein